MKSFNVIYQDFNSKKFIPYDIIPYFVNKYNKLKKKDRPKKDSQLKVWIESEAKYMFWSRCEYEILIAGWPNTETVEKWDIYKQIMMNIDVIVELIVQEINIK